MSIATNLQRLVTAKSDIAEAITAKGGTVNQGDGLEEFPADIASIPSGGGGITNYTETIGSPGLRTTKMKAAKRKYDRPTKENKTWYGIPCGVTFDAQYIWSDGTNVYYSKNSAQYVFDETTSAWNVKTWSGLTSFSGIGIWKDYEGVIYYYNSNGTTYQLDIATSTWTKVTWYSGSETTSYSPNFIWTFEGVTYYSYGSEQYVLSKAYVGSSGLAWFNKTWKGLTSFYGDKVWVRDYAYYSYGSTQYYLIDNTYKSWYTKTWSGLTSFDGDKVWSDGSTTYYSKGSTQRQLSGSTWSSKSWTGLTSYNGDKVWSDGTKFYLSDGTSNQYELSDSTWNSKTWNGLTSFNACDVWSDGENIYLSTGTTHYVLNKATSTWSTKTWSGLSLFNGQDIWSDGTNIYYSSGSNQYVLNKATSTWSTKTWSGLTSFSGQYVWSDGTNIYLSYATTSSSTTAYYHYQLSGSTWSSKTWTGLTSFTAANLWQDEYGDMYCNYSSGSSYYNYKLNKESSTWTSVSAILGIVGSRVGTDGVNTIYGYSDYTWTDGDYLYYSAGMTQHVLPKCIGFDTE